MLNRTLNFLLDHPIAKKVPPRVRRHIAELAPWLRRRHPIPNGGDCPVCRSGMLHQFDKIKDFDGRIADIFICRSCDALTNSDAYRHLKDHGLEAAQHSDFYTLTEQELAKLPALIAETEGLLEHLAAHVKLRGDQVFCDFGAGRGFVAMQAAKRFRKSIACEWDTRQITTTLAALPYKINNFSFDNDLDQITDTISVLFMWHTLEHLPDPTDFWARHSSKLSEDAIIFLQIPLYRPQHVIRSHYIFYTEESLTHWAASALSAKPVHFGYDTDNAFLSMIARR